MIIVCDFNTTEHENRLIIASFESGEVDSTGTPIGGLFLTSTVKRGMEFLSLLNVRLPGSEEEFCSHGFRYRD
jgi:hypothetical protein